MPVVLLGLAELRSQFAQQDFGFEDFADDVVGFVAAQADALDKLLKSKGRKIDSVIELKVDDGKLVDRIENRARETLAAGGTVRADDNAEALKTRLMAYYRETAPIIGYYFAHGLLKSIDGMAPIAEVSQQIDEILNKYQVA